MWLSAFSSWADLRHETFDQAPSWDGLNNFSTIEMRPVVQDFGYKTTTNCNAIPGEVGGTITPDARLAYYAKELTPLSFDDSFTASGKMVGGGGNTLLGFFNPDTANEWRQADSAVFRIYGRGGTCEVHFEYGTSLWRVSAGFVGAFTSGVVCTWSLTYTPIGMDSGELVAVFNGQSATCTLTAGHRGDGATFTHFGLLPVLKHPDDIGNIWIDEVVINGVPEDFSVNPGWDAFQTVASYMSEDTRPRFAFGYSATQFAGGPIPGEIGGRLFRGDCRFPETLAYYGDPIEELSLENPLEASGKVTFRRGVSDSTTLFGFFNSVASVEVNPSQSEGLPKEFLGIAIEGPSADGFYLYPCYRTEGDGGGRTLVADLAPIYPDSTIGEWTLSYDPEENSGNGEITVEFGGHTSVLPLPVGHKAQGAQFDRFGFVTTWIDGNGQTVYFDNLHYTYDIPTRAQFSSDVTSGDAPLEVSFTDESQSRYTITDWTWNFGDGSPVSHDQNPTHTYTTNGAYNVTLIITTTVDSDTEIWLIDVGNTLPGPTLPVLGIAILAIAAYARRSLRR